MDSLPILASNRLYLIVHPHPRFYEQLFVLCAGLAQRGPVLVVDGNNCFDAYLVARLLRQHEADVSAALQRLRVARAFTCYQMVALIREACLRQRARALSEPVFVLDFLAMFRDEAIPLAERRRLLKDCLPDLRGLSQQAPVLVCARPVDEAGMLETLMQAADEVQSFAPLPEPPVLRLFPE